MLVEKAVILPFREYAIACKRMIKPHLAVIIADGEKHLESLASDVVRYLFHYRTLRRQAWRIREPANSTALGMALHRYDTYPMAARNLEIILESLILGIEQILDNYVPMNTMDVLTVDYSFGELVLTNHGDYRILKFMEENPHWKPTTEEPEQLILNANQCTNFPY